MIIIPDVHGRTFWKDVVQKRENSEKVVFLGDYLDPYPSEGISSQDAIDNFKEILEYIKENKDTTIALLGNHDFMTYLSLDMGSCRTDFLNAGLISGLFKENLDLFKVAYEEGKYIFSHSAILPGWFIENCKNGILRKSFFNQEDTVEDIVKALNWSLKNDFDSLTYVLDQVSWLRGGCSDYGSSVWADVHEVPRNQCWPGKYMIFGHSQQISDPIITPYWACLDCRKGFRLNTETGEIVEL